MKIGSTVIAEEKCLVMKTEQHWINLSLAHEEYLKEGGEQPTHASRDIVTLMHQGLFARDFFERIAGFIQKSDNPARYNLEDIPRFSIPLQPGKIIGIGRNYKEHAAEMNNPVPDEPIVFCKASSSCIGDSDPVVLQPRYGRVDHEGEIGVVMGKRAKCISADQAFEYIAGYTLLNDITARTMQKKAASEGKPWFLAKSLDTFCPVGPVVVLVDTLPWPPQITLTLRVNGEIRQQGNTSDMIFSIAGLIAYVTRHITLEPGDLIATGTPQGVGPIEPGDVLEVFCAEIGILRNPVVKY